MFTNASQKLPGLMVLACLMGAAPMSQAGTTTIYLRTASGTCIATTNDADGVHLDPQGGSALVVDDVTLSEDPANGPNSHVCTNGGNGGGTPITVALNLSATTATSGSPPNPSTLTVSSAANAQMANMPCTGSLLLNGGTSITTGWAGWTQSFNAGANGAISQQVTVPNAVASGSYVFKLSCSSGTQTASDDVAAPATLTVTSPVQTSCAGTTTNFFSGIADTTPRVRFDAADIQYNAVPTGTRPSVPFAEFANLWGYADSTATSPVGWPGIVGSSPGFMMPRNGYFGAYFKTPLASDPPPANTSGYFTYTTYGATDPISVSISTQCGDFSGDPNVNACYANNVASADTSSLKWVYDSGGQQGVSKYFCYLKPGTKYYLNMMFTSTQQQVGGKCTTPSTTGMCRIRYTRR